VLQPMAGPARLRELLAAGRLLVAPGVYDGLSARIAEQAGFEVLYVSGGAVARSMGLPDVGLVSLTETAKRVEEIRAVTSGPLVVDADTGYGNELNVIRTVRTLERAGAAAIHLEDQVTPKKCGHYQGHQLIEAEAMVRKIRAALDARQDPNLLIIARTDARSAVGLEEAIRRGRLYFEAGAEIIFIEAPRSEAELERIGQELAGIPLLVNMFHGGKTPLVPKARLEALGYRLMIVPSDLQRAAIWGMQRAARLLRERGETTLLVGEMAGFAERDQIVGLPEVEALERRYLGGDGSVGRGDADEPKGRAEGTGRPMGGGGAGRLAAGGRRGRGGRLGASRARSSRCRAPARRSSGRRRLARTGAGGLGGTPLARGAAGADPDRP